MNATYIHDFVETIVWTEVTHVELLYDYSASTDIHGGVIEVSDDAAM